MSEKHAEPTSGGHYSQGKYLVGFGLALVLTLLSFGIAAAGVQPKYVAIIGLSLAAMVQILVHLHYFLHLDRSGGAFWNVISISFTALIVFIFIAGTVWIILTLNARMM